MSGAISGTRLSWGGTVDKEGHRTYKLVQLVEVSDTEDGPGTVLETPGLPFVGSFWSQGNEFDLWAICLPTRKISIHQPKAGDKNVWWEVESTFSTKPTERCQDTPIEDPLLEPQKISGSFVKYTKPAFFDKNGDEILSSSHERLPIEVDDNHPTVRISQNVGALGLGLFTPMVNKVNDAALWEIPARGVKLANVSWSRKVLGICSFYYTRTFEFDIDASDDGFNIEIADEGYMHVKPGGNQEDIENGFIHIKDSDDENVSEPRPLDGAGNVAANRAAIHTFDIAYYKEANFLELGIPTIL